MIETRRLPILLAVIATALGCGPTGPVVADELVTVSGYLRYEAAPKILEAELIVPDSLYTVPLFEDERMKPVAGFGGRKFRSELPVGTVSTANFTLVDGGQDLIFSIPLAAVTIDSLADSLTLDQTISLEIADRGLTDTESIIFFFEPVAQGTPRRILINGPTGSGTIDLPLTVTGDIPPGVYEVQLVKQQLVKSRQKNIKLSIKTEYFTVVRRVTIG